jgi:hypothetical protein
MPFSGQERAIGNTNHAMLKGVMQEIFGGEQGGILNKAS